MAQPYINPLGFIDRPTQDGAVILLTNPEESLSLRPGTPITVWRYSPEHLALGKLRGRITAIGYTTATFVTEETQKGPRWPNGTWCAPQHRSSWPWREPSSRTPPGNSPRSKPRPCAGSLSDTQNWPGPRTDRMGTTQPTIRPQQAPGKPNGRVENQS